MNVSSAASQVVKRKKVWLVHGSHTGGHASAAKSLKESLDRYDNVDTEIVNLASASKSPVPASTLAEVALKGGKWVNNIRTWVFDQQFEGNLTVKWATDKLMAFEGKAHGSFLKRAAAEKPDVIISTMSATNSMLSSMRESGELKVPVQSVVTDFASHQVWAQDNIAFYYVATDGVQKDLEKFGVPKDKVRVTGIPIRRAFAESPQSPQEAKESLGLDPKKPTVLILGGSLGYGNFEESALALDKVDGDFQIAAITGRNEQLQHKLEGLELDHDMTVRGYVDNMPSWLSAADVVVSKPGGLSSSEILAKGKPMIIKDALAGLESRMVGRLVDTGAAVAVEGDLGLSEKFAQLLKSPEERNALTRNAEKVGRPNSSADIAEYILSDIA